MTDLDPRTLLAAYNSTLRARVPDPLPDGATVEYDGPLIRLLNVDRDGFLTYTDLRGLHGAELDALIERQRAYFADLNMSAEWKLHGHDEPADLGERLRAGGFEPEAQETVVIGPIAGVAAALPVIPDGVRLREVRTRADLDRIEQMEAQVWGSARPELAERLERELATSPQELTVVVAEADEVVVSAGWVRYVTGTGFATLWGGSTLQTWRGQGIYRALVTYRARLAAARGFTMLQVDASDESRPILERLGFVPVTTTTPYVFHP